TIKNRESAVAILVLAAKINIKNLPGLRQSLTSKCIYQYNVDLLKKLLQITGNIEPDWKMFCEVFIRTTLSKVFVHAILTRRHSFARHLATSFVKPFHPMSLARPSFILRSVTRQSNILHNPYTLTNVNAEILLFILSDIMLSNLAFVIIFLIYTTHLVYSQTTVSSTQTSNPTNTPPIQAFTSNTISSTVSGAIPTPLSSISTDSSNNSNKVIAVYYAYWKRSFLAENNLPWAKITHVNFAFAIVDNQFNPVLDAQTEI
ncbi:13174_t:CDS:2, partial [Dentiscutata heterogama]